MSAVPHPHRETGKGKVFCTRNSNYSGNYSGKRFLLLSFKAYRGLSLDKQSGYFPAY